MKEHQLYKDILKGTELSGWTCFRINDGSLGRKPFDICGVTNTGRGVAIEVKVCRSDTLPEHIYTMLSSHQLAWLKLYAKAGAVSLLLVHHKNCIYGYRLMYNIIHDTYFTLFISDNKLVRGSGFWTGLERFL